MLVWNQSGIKKTNAISTQTGLKYTPVFRMLCVHVESIWYLAENQMQNSLRIQLPLVRSRYYVRNTKTDVCDSPPEIPY